MKDSIRGYVEQIEHNTVIGWACDLSAPEASARVQARVNGLSVEAVVADILRDDLLEAGIGTGRHGFRMSVAPELYQQLVRGTAEIWVASAMAENWQRLRTQHQVEQDASFASRVMNAVQRIRRSASAAPPPEQNTMSMISAPVELAPLPSTDIENSSQKPTVSPLFEEQLNIVRTPFEVPGKFFGWIDEQESSKLGGWMLATRNATTPILTVDGLPALQNEWPLLRKDVIAEYGVERRTGFQFRFDSAPGAKAELGAFDGHRLVSAASVYLPDTEQSGIAAMIPRLMEDSAKPDAVAVTCWDGGHNPIGRAKVLYDILDGRRPVWLFCYLFDEFGGKLWEPLKEAGLRIVTVPWKQREHYHRLFQVYGIQFPTVWMCKPRLPTLVMASAVGAPDAKLILDFDDNEEHFSKSPGSVGKPYGGETIGLVRSLIGDVAARTAASFSLAEDYKTEIVRHARKPALNAPKRATRDRDRPIRIGFVGTVRPHKRLLEAAQAIRVAGHIAGQKLEFCVHGDIKPTDYRKQLEGNSVKTHGTVLASELEATVQSFDLVLTGYPSQVAGDEPITRYQITSKIGDALVNGIPVLVPRSRSVEDLEDTPGVFLFDTDDFSDVLMKAVNYTKKIKLPKSFTTEGAYSGFEKAEKSAAADTSVLDGLRTTRARKDSGRSVLLIWKQQDGGLYGRRVDQIARAVKLADPDATVRVVEFMNNSVRADLEKKAQSLTSDASQILRLAEMKQAGNATSPEGIIYNQIAVATDAEAPNALIDFLWTHGHTPGNTLMVTFPAFALLTHLAKVIDPFPLISDIVDNQLSWGSNKSKPELIAQYAWLMRRSRQVVFNSSANRDYFKSAGFLKDTPEDKVSVVPNWYMAPSGTNVTRSEQPQTADGSVNVIYSGNLNDRIDWDLMERCAKASPHLRLHIVGDGSRVTDKLRALMEADNVIYHGPLSEERVSRLLRKVHFAIMPHLQDEVSTYMNPLKVLMYAAHGLRSVAVEVPGLNEIEGLQVVETSDAFLEQVLAWVRGVQEGISASIEVPGDMPKFANEYVALVRSVSSTLSTT
jgi:glycosyltransferase involved in cell wall biosynthesis